MRRLEIDVLKGIALILMLIYHIFCLINYTNPWKL